MGRTGLIAASSVWKYTTRLQCICFIAWFCDACEISTSLHWSCEMNIAIMADYFTVGQIRMTCSHYEIMQFYPRPMSRNSLDPVKAVPRVWKHPWLTPWFAGRFRFTVVLCVCIFAPCNQLNLFLCVFIVLACCSTVDNTFNKGWVLLLCSFLTAILYSACNINLCVLICLVVGLIIAWIEILWCFLVLGWVSLCDFRLIIGWLIYAMRFVCACVKCLYAVRKTHIEHMDLCFGLLCENWAEIKFLDLFYAVGLQNYVCCMWCVALSTSDVLRCSSACKFICSGQFCNHQISMGCLFVCMVTPSIQFTMKSTVIFVCLYFWILVVSHSRLTEIIQWNSFQNRWLIVSFFLLH